jgi:hypothetical protein
LRRLHAGLRLPEHCASAMLTEASVGVQLRPGLVDSRFVRRGFLRGRHSGLPPLVDRGLRAVKFLREIVFCFAIPGCAQNPLSPALAVAAAAAASALDSGAAAPAVVTFAHQLESGEREFVIGFLRVRRGLLLRGVIA